MDREEALELLRGGKEGVAEWNRRRNPGESLPLLSDVKLADSNLAGVNLRDVNLFGADLRGANLNDADLSGADCRGGHFTGAQFGEARLRGTLFHGAHLGAAHLRRADLRGADLRGADLSDADLGGTHLYSANFSGTILRGTNMANAAAGLCAFACDLSRARGLDSVSHFAPSVVSIDAVLSFRDSLPQEFLRGCGVRDEEIEYFRTKLGAIHFYSCFISYSHQDEGFAQRLHADLQLKGVRCWFAPEDMKIGDRPLAAINDAIRLREKLVLILSESSINSDWVEHEVNQGLEEEKQRGRDVLFPIRLDSAVMACEFGWAKRLREAHKSHGRHIGDFTRWDDDEAYQKALQRLLRDLRQEAKA